MHAGNLTFSPTELKLELLAARPRSRVRHMHALLSLSLEARSLVDGSGSWQPALRAVQYKYYATASREPPPQYSEPGNCGQRIFMPSLAGYLRCFERTHPWD
ncbi:hypothetical protein TWF696_008518 [Orbilia brochopaga]|uniref:Uncharacterized protein n=1 Tax=Orbilia brochopaga TaxID=3140254 RepID=A0AAV9UJU9_9PEZI